MSRYDPTPCPVSEMPRYSCYDCVNNLHGRPVPENELTLHGEVVGPAHYEQRGDPARLGTNIGASRRTHYADRDSTCEYPGCEGSRIKTGDPLLCHDDYGWVHARHLHD